MSNSEEQVLQIVKERRSKKEAVLREEISHRTGLPDRANREAIASLQLQGYPIVSLNKGYWWGSSTDVEAYVRREKGRAIKVLNKLRGFVPRMTKMVQQLELF